MAGQKPVGHRAGLQGDTDEHQRCASSSPLHRRGPLEVGELARVSLHSASRCKDWRQEGSLDGVGKDRLMIAHHHVRICVDRTDPSFRRQRGRL
jgi:hypothetical protein